MHIIKYGNKKYTRTDSERECNYWELSEIPHKTLSREEGKKGSLEIDSVWNTIIKFRTLWQVLKIKKKSLFVQLIYKKKKIYLKSCIQLRINLTQERTKTTG